MAKFGDLGKVKVGVQAVWDDFSECNHSFQGNSGLQSISYPNILKPVCSPGRESEDGVKVQVCDEIEISASRSQPVYRKQ